MDKFLISHFAFHWNGNRIGMDENLFTVPTLALCSSLFGLACVHGRVSDRRLAVRGSRRGRARKERNDEIRNQTRKVPFASLLLDIPARTLETIGHSCRDLPHSSCTSSSPRSQTHTRTLNLSIPLSFSIVHCLSLSSPADPSRRDTQEEEDTLARRHR